jgi:hypothetical protein
MYSGGTEIRSCARNFTSGLLYAELDLLEDMPAELSNGIHKMIAGQANKAIPLLQGLDDHTIVYILLAAEIALA